MAGQKQKGPKKSIKRERFLIQFFLSLLRRIFLLDHIFLLRHIWVQFGTAVWLVRGS